jgi:hypothetical protein
MYEQALAAPATTPSTGRLARVAYLVKDLVAEVAGVPFSAGAWIEAHPASRQYDLDQSARWQIDYLRIAHVRPHTGTEAEAGVVAMVPMIFLVGTLIGLLIGAVVCMRYFRQEMVANVSPRLRLIQLHLEQLESELELVLATRAADRHRPLGELYRPPAA